MKPHEPGFRQPLLVWTMTLAWLAQGLSLWWLAASPSQGRSAGAWIALWGLPLLVSVAGPRFARRLGFKPVAVLDRSAIEGTAAFGGLGMLLGSWIDASLGTGGHTAHLSHAAHPSLAHGSFSMTLMLVFCLPVCLGLCRGRPEPSWRAAVLGISAMVAGMLVGGAVLSQPLTYLTGSDVLGGHLAMLLGMSLGSAVGGIRSTALHRTGSSPAAV